MAIANVRTNSSQVEYSPLPADIYYMKVREADITKSAFKDRDGNDQWQLQLTWEVSRLTAEQEEAEVDESRWVRQWIGLYYGQTKNGPSKLKVFVDGLCAGGLLTEFDPESEQIDSDWFVGIEQRVTLDVKGSYNNVVMVSPLVRPKAAKKPSVTPVAPIKRAPAPAPVAAPVADEGDDEGELFA